VPHRFGHKHTSTVACELNTQSYSYKNFKCTIMVVLCYMPLKKCRGNMLRDNAAYSAFMD
jgi:hypothetical protein